MLQQKYMEIKGLTEDVSLKAAASMGVNGSAPTIAA